MVQGPSLGGASDTNVQQKVTKMLRIVEMVVSCIMASVHCSGMSVGIRASDTKTHLMMAKSQLGKWTSIVDSEPQQRHQKINPLVEAEEV